MHQAVISNLAPTPPPLQPINIRQYAKVRELGKGSHGVCSVVRHISSGKNFVLKEVDMTGMDKKMQQSTMNESMVLCTLTHPNIIRYEGSAVVEGREDSTLHILMEYAAGGDMYSRVSRQRGRGPISEVQVVDWFIQMLLAVKYMHRLHILHRDIKSHNVFLTADGVVKVGDFGICRVLDHTLANAYSFVGTPYYLSPELLQRKPYNFASDMWALGVLLCEMMVQCPPFQGHDMDSLRKNILAGRYQAPSPAVYSKELRNIVSMLLQQNPKARPCANRLLHNPYLRTRMQMWFEESNLKIPRPPDWYLREVRESGVLDEMFSPQFGIGMGGGGNNIGGGRGVLQQQQQQPQQSAEQQQQAPAPPPVPAPPTHGKPQNFRKPPLVPQSVAGTALPPLPDNKLQKVLPTGRGHGRRHYAAM